MYGRTWHTSSNFLDNNPPARTLVPYNGPKSTECINWTSCPPMHVCMAWNSTPSRPAKCVPTGYDPTFAFQQKIGELELILVVMSIVVVVLLAITFQLIFVFCKLSRPQNVPKENTGTECVSQV